MNKKIVLVICLLLLCAGKVVPKAASKTNAWTIKSISAPSVIPSSTVLVANKRLKSSRRWKLLIVSSIAAGIGSYLAYKIFVPELAIRNANNFLEFSNIVYSYDSISYHLWYADYSEEDIYTLARHLSTLRENRGPATAHLLELRKVQPKAINFLNRKQEVAVLIGHFERILSDIDNTFKRCEAYMKLCEACQDGQKIIDKYSDGLKKPFSVYLNPLLISSNSLLYQAIVQNPSLVHQLIAQRSVLEYLNLDQLDPGLKKKMHQLLLKWHPDKNRTLVKNALGEELVKFAQENDYNHMKTLAENVTRILNQILEK